jgi:hypothetical protein
MQHAWEIRHTHRTYLKTFKGKYQQGKQDNDGRMTLK